MTRTATLAVQPRNRILLQLPAHGRATLLAGADRVRVPVGSSLARAGDSIAGAFLPYAGLITVVSEMATGHQVAVTAVGQEGVLGGDGLFGVQRHPPDCCSIVVPH